MVYVMLLELGTFRVNAFLLKKKMDMCTLDQAHFIWFDKGLLSGIACIRVDDFC